MNTPADHESTTLYYRRGSSDKVYQIAVEPSGDGFVVTFAYGRRENTLHTGAKTADPVPIEQARQIYARLVKEKTAKGYTPGEDGTPYQQSSNPKLPGNAKQSGYAERITGILPQLLNAIDESETRRYLADARYWAQEKFDGRRILVRRAGDTVTGVNRLGLSTGLPKSILDHARGLGTEGWLIDGEAVGDNLYVFDLLESSGLDLRSRPYLDRLGALAALCGGGPGAPIRLVETATSTAAKRAMLGRLREENKEGIVFKRQDTPHSPGRPARGGDWLKLKFTATASCIVAGINAGKRSVAIELINGRGRARVGSVTIPVNAPIPAAGQIVEIRYLYAFPGGSLYQPVFLGQRDDVQLSDCTVSRLKFKAAGDGADED
jgi:bifunctional non-homologous end joining protein LigD